MSKVVFVGNVPYNMGEEQLIEVFKTVGQVVGFRLVFDRETGKPRGYGFCEFADHETATSAVRNLNNVDVGGRPLRIDLADSDPFLEGKTTVRGELIDDPRGHWRDRQRDRDREREREKDGRDHRERDHHRDPPKTQDPTAFLSALPAGVPISPGSTALDTISQTLATMNPTQLVEVLAQMKAFVITHPEQARVLLVAHPQFAYALFQALLLNKIVDQSVLQRMLQATVAGSSPPIPSQPSQMPYQRPVIPPTMAAPPMVAPPPAAPSLFSLPAHMPPNIPTNLPPSNTPPYYRSMPLAQPTIQPQAPAPLSNINIDPGQREMLLQVLNLTQEQINGLPPTERDAIQALRNQFMSGITS